MLRLLFYITKYSADASFIIHQLQDGLVQEGKFSYSLDRVYQEVITNCSGAPHVGSISHSTTSTVQCPITSYKTNEIGHILLSTSAYACMIEIPISGFGSAGVT